MRRFKSGDKVRAFLDSSFAGNIVDIKDRPSSQWLAEGTASIEFIATVRMRDGSIRNIKLSELMHDDD